jgi:short-subunit dehydrogenase
MSIDVRGRWAVVTGASSGLGVDFAKQLAALGVHLILVARREQRMQTLATELRQRYAIEVDVIALDLANPESSVALHARTQARDVAILINNAGFGLYGADLTLPWQREREMLELDMLTVTQLIRLYARDMTARGRGHILNVASLAGTQPAPMFAAYGAAKSFVINYSVAMREELKSSGVACTVMCPGATETEFFDVSRTEQTLYVRATKMQSADVVRDGIRAMLQNRPVIIPGLFNRISVLCMNVLPRSWVAAIVHFIMRRASTKQLKSDNN